MLKTRVFTAVIMAAVALGAIFGLPNTPFALVAGVVILGVGGWEASRLCGSVPKPVTWAFPTVLFGLGLVIWFGPSEAIHHLLLALVAVAWLIPMGWLGHPQKGHHYGLIAVLLALILIGAWLSLVLLHAQNPWLIIWVLVIVAGADIGAYFTGRAIGGAKLAPEISPGKTWAGAWGGLTSAAVLAPLGAQLLPVDVAFLLPHFVLLGILLAAISIAGDLFISLLKRQAGLKDSSALLPGHGGILDRLDSLGAALPFFALALLWLQQA